MGWQRWTKLCALVFRTSPLIIEAAACVGIAVVGHLGRVPRHVTWTGCRAIGKTAEQAKLLSRALPETELNKSLALPVQLMIPLATSRIIATYIVSYEPIKMLMNGGMSEKSSVPF